MSSSEHNVSGLNRAVSVSQFAVPFSKFMEDCLYGENGFYQKKAKLGGTGADFYTSAQFPLFGLTLGKYVYDWWQSTGEQEVIQIAELGPGQGELAEAVCSYLVKKADSKVVIRYLLVERADAMTRAQTTRLSPLMERIEFYWGSGEDSKLDTSIPVIVLANEWLDALPVERVKRAGGSRWLQAYVQLDPATSLYSWLWRDAAPHVSNAASRGLPIPDDHMGEICLLYPQVFELLRQLADVVHAVFIDYGSVYAEFESGVRPEGTLRAYHQHELVDVLTNPGSADITADVNWDYFRDEAERCGCKVDLLQSQAVFLMDAGLLDVAQERTELHREELDRRALSAADVGREIKTLVLPGGLGERFSVLKCNWHKGDAGEKC